MRFRCHKCGAGRRFGAPYCRRCGAIFDRGVDFLRVAVILTAAFVALVLVVV